MILSCKRKLYSISKSTCVFLRRLWWGKTEARSEHMGFITSECYRLCQVLYQHHFYSVSVQTKRTEFPRRNWKDVSWCNIARIRDENPFNFYLPLLIRQLTILGEVRKYKWTLGEHSQTFFAIPPKSITHNECNDHNSIDYFIHLLSHRKFKGNLHSIADGFNKINKNPVNIYLARFDYVP